MVRDAHKRGTLEERFWRYVRRSDDPDACWEWIGGHTPDGYGSMGLGRDKDGKHRTGRSNRIAHRLLVGPIPQGVCVCHTCDNRDCVNPKHLFLGSRADNLRDMYAKGRGAGQFEPGVRATPETEFRSGENRGEGNPTSKYTAEQVREARRLVASGMSQAEAARQLGMSRASIWQIVHRKQWKHI